MIEPIFFNPFYKPEDTILIAGSGRSGTTWLGDIIGSSPGFLSLFEPFDPRHVPQKNISSLRLYLRANKKSHYLDELIHDVFYGKLRNEWILSQNTRKITWRILIKEIRANLFLGYLKNRFKNKIVFIVRHPCSVVLSRIESKWETHIDDFLKQEELMEDFLSPFESLMNNAENEFEKHAIMWSVENLVPLRQLSKEDYTLCFYEDLIQKENEEMRKIFGEFGLRVPSNIKKIVSKPSRLSNNKKKIEGVDRLTYWKSKLKRKEIETILKIVHSFGVDMYTDDIMPNLDCNFLK
jgi:hypothetical protein